MNLIDEEFQTKKVDNSKKMTKMILAIMAILVLIIIGIFCAIMYIKQNTLRLYINGVENEKVKSMMVIEEDETIYFPIRDIATYLGYESYSGEFTEKSEEASKCYIQSEDEITNFSLNSNKMYKLLMSDKNGNYDYFYSSKPVKAINGKLYAPIDAIETAFNISFGYTSKNTINIYTTQYLIESYSTRILDYGYDEISEVFTNKKAVLNNMLVVTKNQGKNYAVIDVKGNVIIEPKYDYIEYLPNSGDFLVESNKKVGIISAKKETKVQILYNNLELIDKDVGLYVARIDQKYGVIDSKGNIVIHIEYDEIGIDNTLFEKNDIKNKYLLDNGMIPVKKDNLWGAFNKNGNKILDIKYDSLGYVASNNKNAMNLLIIPEYNVLVACQNKKYTLINSVGKELCYPVLDDVYMTISLGEKHYYMNYGENIEISVIDFLNTLSAQQSSNQGNTKQTSNENTNVDEE